MAILIIEINAVDFPYVFCTKRENLNHVQFSSSGGHQNHPPLCQYLPLLWGVVQGPNSPMTRCRHESCIVQQHPFLSLAKAYRQIRKQTELDTRQFSSFEITTTRQCNRASLTRKKENHKVCWVSKMEQPLRIYCRQNAIANNIVAWRVAVPALSVIFHR